MFGEINTVSRAVMVLGTESIGHLALGLKLVDSLATVSSSSAGVRTEMEKAVLAGHIARQVTAQASTRDAEEAVVCSLLHGLGRLHMGNPGAYRATHELVPFYWWVENEKGRTTDQTWQADWVQHSAGVIPGAQQFGKEWFAHTAAVRMTMLGASGTQVYSGDGPIVDSPPYAKLDGDAEGTVPMVVA